MDIRDYLRFEPAGRTIADLDTPVPVIDIAVADRNLRRWQARCDARGLHNRPHVKTHKIAGLARFQTDLGARGITVQKLGEAEVMAAAGLDDMLLTFNILGRSKLERLAALRRRIEIAVVADNIMVVEGLGWAGQHAGRDIRVLVECDTGAKRNGVPSPAAAVDLGKRIDATPGLAFGGLMTYPRAGTREATAAFLEEACLLARKAGLDPATVSSGGSPDMWRDEGLDPVTEYRAGTYIYFDRSLASRGTCDFKDCAASILTTVVSRPVEARAMLDAGSKSLTSDLLGMKGYGIVPQLEGAVVYDLSEEHGFLDVSAVTAKPAIGSRLRVIPNHICPVINLFDRVIFVDGEDVLGAVRVDARGLVQ